MTTDPSNNDEPATIPPYAQESLLIDALGEMSGERILCTSPGLAQFAVAAATAFPTATVESTYLDLYRAKLAIAAQQDPSSSGRGQSEGASLPLTNLHIECATDLPEVDADIIALPFSASGESELVRDLLQSAHERLRLDGKLYATTHNPNDIWLEEQLRKIFRKVSRRPSDTGVLYVATKTEPLKKRKDFSCEFAFRDRGRLIRAYSRPGVFSHRHIDPGARHLIDAMQIEPGMRVLDVGCGAGTVALAAACRVADVTVHAIDSNARAVECTERGAALNDLTNLTTELNADGHVAAAGTYDLALANPPYYAHFRIARHFLTTAQASLRPGGQLLLVTKHPGWYAENMARWFADVTMTERKGYCVYRGTRDEA